MYNLLTPEYHLPNIIYGPKKKRLKWQKNYTLHKKLKEQFENTSDLNGKKHMLNIYTRMDCLMC